MCVVDLDRCDCSCHHGMFARSKYRHVSPCCRTCPECSEHIKIWAFDRHLEGHRNARDYAAERSAN